MNTNQYQEFDLGMKKHNPSKQIDFSTSMCMSLALHIHVGILFHASIIIGSIINGNPGNQQVHTSHIYPLFVCGHRNAEGAKSS